MSILVNFKTPIKGVSDIKEHTEWLNVDSIQLGVGRSISQSGGGNDRDVSNPSFSEVTFTRRMDKASPELFIQAAQGKSLGKCEIHLTQAGQDALVYLTIELEEPYISSYSTSSGGDHPTESFSVNFVQIMMRYDSILNGKVTKGVPQTFDLRKVSLV